MEQLSWQTSFETGIEEIDNQHRQLLGYLNQLSSAIHTKDNTQVEQVIEGLNDYTISHFAFEEALMQEVGYDFAGPHKHVHQMLIEKVVAFDKKVKEGEDIADELYAFLRRWLINHIQRDDAAYVRPVVAHFNKKKSTAEGNDKSDERSGWMSNMVKKIFG